jgi:tetratricopeptide (TPR) repeat protein
MESLRSLPPWAKALGMVLLVLVAFGSALPNGWIWDDDDYVTENPLLTEEGGLDRIWSEPSALPQYYPLVHTTFWIERRLWGDAEDGGPNPFGFHLTNVLLHGLSAVLLWRLLLRLGLPGAWLLAALWAAHPVNVESVAWVTERKNVLSLALALGALIQWLKWDDRDDWTAFLLGSLCFAGALASKTVVASAPAVALLLLWWKRRPLRPQVWAGLGLLLLLGGLAGWKTAMMEVEHVGAEGEFWAWTWAERALIAGRIAWSYAGTLAWPAELIFIYPQWEVDTGQLLGWVFPLAALALIAVLALRTKAWGRGPLAAVLIFGGVLFPALGFLNVYPHQFSFTADHFQYHAAPALIVLLGRVLFFGRDGAPRAELTSFGAPALVVLLGVLSFRQGFVYEDAETLWQDTVERNPEASIGWNNLGLMAYERSLALEPTGDAAAVEAAREQAIEYLEKAVETGPKHAQALNNLGQLLLHHRPPSAQLDARIEGMLRTAVEVAPEYVKPWVNLGDLMRRNRRVEEAISAYETANRMNARSMERLQGPGAEGRVPQVSVMLGELRLVARQPQQAVEDLRYATQSGATAVRAAIALVWVYSTHPDPAVRDGDQAMYWVDQLRRSQAARDPRVLDASAAALAEKGQFEAAVQTQQDALFGAMQLELNELSGKMRERLTSYRAGQPLRTRFGLPE